MTDFSVTGLLEISVSDRSLREAQSKIEEGLSGTTVGVSASNQLASSQSMSRGAGGGLGAGALAASAGGVTSQLSENVSLNETRNELLRDILDATRKGAAGGGGGFLPRLPRGGGRILRLLGGTGGAVAAVLGSSLAAVAWSDVVKDAVGEIDISPSDIVDPVAVTAPVLVGAAATITAADVIADKAGVDAGDVVEAVTLVPGALIAGKATITAADVITSAVGLEASDVVEAVSLVPGALIASKAAITVDDLIVEPLALTVDKLVDAAKGKETGDGGTEDGGTEDENTENTGDGVLGLGALAATGAFGAASGALLGPTLARQSGSLLSASTGALAPVMTRDMFMGGLNNLGGKDFDQSLQDAGVDVPQGGPTGAWQFWQEQGDALGKALNIDGRDPALEAGKSSYKTPENIQLADDGSGRNPTSQSTGTRFDVTVNNDVTIRDERDLRQKLREQGLDPDTINRVVEEWEQMTGRGR